MQIGPGLFGSLFTGFRRWELGFDGQSTFFHKAGRVPIAAIPLDTVTVATAKRGAIWAEIKVEAPDQCIRCDGVVNDDAERFVDALKDAVGVALLATFARHESALRQLTADVVRLVTRQQYLANRDIEIWKAAISVDGSTSLGRVVALIGNPLLPLDSVAPESRERIDLIADLLLGPRTRVRTRNDRFVAEEIVRHKTFFDTVEKDPLTAEQRVAAVVMEDRNLLVAAAGAGKTSTVVGKVGYALLTKQYAPSEFLVLAFNNDAAKELDERINAQLRPLLPDGERIKATTFHALGLEIMATASGKKPSIANFAGGSDAADSALMEQLIQQRMANDKDFAADWVTFRAVCFKAARNPADFKTLDEWNQFVRANGDYQNGKRGFLTINGEIVKSQGELAIANWFYMQGVDYEYERPYEYDTADLQHRQYRPDFYLPVVDTYLEHYALDESGQPPAAFGTRYAESIRWKEQLHAEKATALIVTTFADFVSGRLFSNLEAEMKKRGQRLSPKPLADVLARLNEFQKTDYGSFLRTFVKHAKSNEVDEPTLRARIEGNPQPYRAHVFVRVLTKLMDTYEARLRQHGEIDFEDMIIHAAHDVAKNRYQHAHKLILVDEFQDISQARAKLLKALLVQRPDCKLFAVGDDWQSIYRFAGSDIDVFTRFSTHLGVTEIKYLTQTFRSNQGITDVASRFIEKNPSQIKKRVRARNPRSRAVVVIRCYGKLEEMEDKCESGLAEIAQGLPASKCASVFVLARYTFQRPNALDAWQARWGMLDINFKTVHSSKGLQADYVIVLGLHTGRYGFPSGISDDSLLQLVMPHPESFTHAEERRLLYVALTRARHRVYLLGGASFPSAFLTELTQDESLRESIQPDPAMVPGGSGSGAAHARGDCPRCKSGRLRERTGKHGQFLGCSNYPSCSYTRDARKSKRR